MHRAGFTLIELVLVLAILVGMAAFVAPTIARSSRARALEQEGLRLVGLTEYARNEAVSRGAAFAIYIDSQKGTYGMEPASTLSGVETRKAFSLPDELHFGAMPSQGSKQNRVITFTPEGTSDVASIDAVTLVDRQGGSRRVVRQDDGWAYELEKEASR